MGIYYAAVDNASKKYFEPPGSFSNKIPFIFHPENPFPAMVVMMNCHGHKFVIENDMPTPCYYDKGYENITEAVFNDLLETFPEYKKFYGLTPEPPKENE